MVPPTHRTEIGLATGCGCGGMDKGTPILKLAWVSARISVVIITSSIRLLTNEMLPPWSAHQFNPAPFV